METGQCDRALSRVRKYWIPALGSKHLSELDPSDLIDFATDLLKTGSIAAGTRNAIMLVGKTALNWAFDKDLIEKNLTKGIPSISGEKDARGILTIKEAKWLFQQRWPSEMMRLGSLTAAATGMRASEVVAFRPRSLGDDFIDIRESFVEGRGIGPLKNKECRVVKVDPRLVQDLRDLASRNPTESGFVFWDEGRPSAPLYSREFNLALRELLIRRFQSDDDLQCAAPSGKEYWDSRNVDFHSWRHFAISHASRSGAPKKALMRASGHKTERIFDDYSDHGLEDDLTESGEAFGKAFCFGGTL